MLDRPGGGTLIDRLMATVARIAALHDVRTAIGPDDSLVDAGMTSMAMVDLILAIEADFDVAIPQTDMTPDTFRSARSLANLLARL